MVTENRGLKTLAHILKGQGIFVTPPTLSKLRGIIWRTAQAYPGHRHSVLKNVKPLWAVPSPNIKSFLQLQVFSQISAGQSPLVKVQRQGPENWQNHAPPICQKAPLHKCQCFAHPQRNFPDGKNSSYPPYCAGTPYLHETHRSVCPAIPRIPIEYPR